MLQILKCIEIYLMVIFRVWESGEIRDANVVLKSARHNTENGGLQQDHFNRESCCKVFLLYILSCLLQPVTISPLFCTQTSFFI
jgi:hypothetical protein